MSRPRPTIIQLIAISALSPFGMHLIIPAITPIQAEFGITAGTASFLISGTLWGIAVSTLIFGAFSDRFGRRPILTIGLILYLLGSSMGAFGQDAWFVITGRVVQGIGGAAGIVVSRAVIRDLYARDKGTSVMAYVTMAIMFAPVLAPSFAGFAVEHYGWRSVFDIAAILGIVVLAWVVRRFPESLEEPIAIPSAFAMVGAYASVLREPVFVAYSLVGSFVMTAFFAMMSGAPHVAELAWQLPKDQLGYYLGLAGLGMMISTFITARVAEHVDNNKLMLAGLGCHLTAVLLMSALFALGFNHPASLFGPMLITGLGSGFVLPTATTGALAIIPRMAGTASGMMIFMQFAIAGTAAQAIGFFDHTTAWSTIGFMIGATCLGMISALAAVRLDRKRVAA